MSSWYDSAWSSRIAIAVDNSAGGTATYSFVLTIPRDIDAFWDFVQSDGGDLILTESDGFTAVSATNATALEFDNGSGAAFSGSTRAGRIRLDKYTGGAANSSCYMWLYFGNAASSASNAFSAWTSPATVTARIEREGGNRVSPKILTRPEEPGSTVPRVSLSKVSTETKHIYWDFSAELNQRDEPYEGRLWHEGIKYAVLSAETGTVNNTAVITATDVTMLGTRGGVLRTKHPAGSSGTDYTIKLKVTTTTSRVLDRRCVLAVDDPDETP